MRRSDLPRPSPAVLVLIAGPIAAGKSAVSRRLAEDLRRAGRQIALVELDTLADMARPTLPDWADAHRIFALVTQQWLRAGLDTVIAESVSSRQELDQVLQDVPAGTPVLTVIVECRADIALERAMTDPSRGISRDPGFLRVAHARWALEREMISADVELETGRTSLEESVSRIQTALAEVLTEASARPRTEG